MKVYYFYIIFVVLTVGCATRDNTDFQKFNQQLLLLSEETALVLQSTKLLSETNRSEAIAEQNPELLESIILHREDTFLLLGDSTTFQSVLLGSIRSAKNVTETILYYSLLLTELTNESDFSLEIATLLNPYLGNFAPAIGLLVHQGKLEKSSEATQLIMLSADSTIRVASNNMASALSIIANAVQITYADMAARRQRIIIIEKYPIELINELIQLNNLSVEILSKLEILSKAWNLVPEIHSELASSLTNTSTSTTLTILGSILLNLQEGL